MWHRIAAVLLTLHSVIGDRACQNPLFETHWFCRNDPDTINDYAVIKTNLRLCPAYNQKKSCCHQTFENEQIRHFQYWRQIFTAKLFRVGKAKRATLALKESVHFSTATNHDLEQYNRVLNAFDAVLDPANHADCFSALITYVAGMLCFSCESEWYNYIQMIRGKVVRVLIANDVCVEFWARCRDFGDKTMYLKQSFLDSKLAVLQQKQFENIDMFGDQQRLCDWMHSYVGMHPFTTPGESQREAAPAAEIIKGRRLDATNRSTDDEEVRQLQEALLEYDPMQQGKASGFDINWGGVVPTGAGQRASSFIWSLQVVFMVALGSALL